jgi:hypothetical protein
MMNEHANRKGPPAMKFRDADAMSDNIERTIRSIRREGTTGMSLINLYHITPTTGVNCMPDVYANLFATCAKTVAKKLRFTLL